jgi:cytochrome oxidase assembly protein ShyY1
MIQQLGHNKTVLDLLRTKRWIGFTLLVITVIVAFGFLSHWQLSRAQDRREERIALDVAATVSPTALPSDTKLLNASEWNRFNAIGTFDGSKQVVVRKRPLNGTNGYWVMTPFTERSGQTIWVNRGWFPASGAATTMPNIVAPPTGLQSIIGAYRFFEDASESDLIGLPTGMIPAPAIAVLPAVASAPGYLLLTSPAQPELTMVPTPEIDEVQNMSYAGQWLLFALVAIVGWFIFLKREAADDKKRDSATASL